MIILQYKCAHFVSGCNNHPHRTCPHDYEKQMLGKKKRRKNLEQGNKKKRRSMKEKMCTTHPFGTSTISSFCTLQRPRRFPPASTPLSSSVLKAASMTASSPISAFLGWQARMSLSASAGKQTATPRPLPAYQEVALSSTSRKSSPKVKVIHILKWNDFL